MGRAFEYRKAAKMKRWGKYVPRISKTRQNYHDGGERGGEDPDMNPNSAKRFYLKRKICRKTTSMRRSNVHPAKMCYLFAEMNIREKGRTELCFSSSENR